MGSWKSSVADRAFQIKWDIRVIDGWMKVPGADLGKLQADRDKLITQLARLEGEE